MKKYNQYQNNPDWEFVPYSKMKDGGSVDDYNTNHNGMQPVVEAEKGETVQIPNGLIDQINSGGKHSELTNGSYGTPLNLPEGSKIFSEKLKNPISGKSYAKEAKKFETKKDLKNLDNAMDKIALDTSNLNISLKNQLSDALFQLQERNKLNGSHGDKVQQGAMDEYETQEQQPSDDTTSYSPTNNLDTVPDSQGEYNYKKFGGLMKVGFGDKIDNNPSLRGTKKGVEEDFNSLDDVYNNYVKNGYKGVKDITQMRQWAHLKNPQEVDAYINRSEPTNKHREIWYSKYDPNHTQPFPRLNEMTPEDRFAGYNDNLWDFRANKFIAPSTPPKVKPPIVGDAPLQSPLANFNKSGNSFKSNGLNLNFAIPNVNTRLPLGTTQLTPQYVNPSLLNIQPELNESQRGYNSFANNIGSRGTNDISNLLQGQINQYQNNQKIFGNKYNADNQSVNQANQFNAQSKMSTDVQNLGERNRFLDSISRREGAIGTQQLIDNRDAVQNQYLRNQDESTRAFIQESNPWYNPQGNLTTGFGNDYSKSALDKQLLEARIAKLENGIKKFGGMIKKPIKLGKKK